MMNIPYNLKILACIFSCSVFCATIRASDCEHKSDASRPNLVLIYVDDLDFDEIATYDYKEFPCFSGAEAAGAGSNVEPPIHQNMRDLKHGETFEYKDTRMLTPHIDSLAEDGMRFDRFYVTSAACTPSRYTLLTGRLASRSPALLEDYPAGGPVNIRWNTKITPDESNLVKELNRLGYRTGMTGKWHNGEPKALREGVGADADLSDPETLRQIEAAHDEGIAWLEDQIGFDTAEHVTFANKEWWPLPERLKVHNLEWITQGAVEFIEAESPEPFFLYVAYPVPHGVYFEDWAESDLRATQRGLLEQAPDVQPSRESVLERLKEQGIDPRNAMATWIDDSVGAILDALEAQGVEENTLVAFISDHQARGKNSCYEGTRVPAIMRWPGQIAESTVTNALSANTDIAPTFISIAGGTAPQEIAQDGSDLLPLLRGETDKNHDFIYLEMNNSRAVLTERWKLLLNRPSQETLDKMAKDAEDAIREGRPRRASWDGVTANPKWGGIWFSTEKIFPHYFDATQFYDLKEDIFEQHNLIDAPELQNEVQELTELLRMRIDELPHTFEIDR